MPEQNDTDLTGEEIIRRINEELVATWGNLVNRVLTITARNFDGKVPSPGPLTAADQQIIDGIVTRYNGEELLVPTSSGVEALAWALPAAAFVAGVAGLIVAFRRWHASARRLGDPTEEDYALVAAALEHDQILEHERIDDEP